MKSNHTTKPNTKHEEKKVAETKAIKPVNTIVQPKANEHEQESIKANAKKGQPIPTPLSTYVEGHGINVEMTGKK